MHGPRRRGVAIGFVVASMFFFIGLDARSDEQAATPSDTIAPPMLRKHIDATYPPQALRERTEARVGLELEVDAEGRISVRSR